MRNNLIILWRGDVTLKSKWIITMVSYWRTWFGPCPDGKKITLCKRTADPLLTGSIQTSFTVRVWIINYINLKQWDVITHPFPRFNGLTHLLHKFHNEIVPFTQCTISVTKWCIYGIFVKCIVGFVGWVYETKVKVRAWMGNYIPHNIMDMISRFKLISLCKSDHQETWRSVCV